MNTASKVKLDNSGLSENDEGEIIALGFLDIEAMRALRTDTYQREFLGNTGRHADGRQTRIMRAIVAGVRLPTVTIGTRGTNYTSQRNSIMVLENPTYIIDGRQRIETLIKYADLNPDKAKNLSISAEVRFDTNWDKENALFHALNAWRTAVSGNVLMRNMRGKNRGVAMLYDWTHNPKAILYNRVQWSQRMTRGQLISAASLAQAIACLHTGTSQFGGYERTAAALENATATFGTHTVRENMVHFLDVLDEAFGLSKIEYRQHATVLRNNFLTTLATLFAHHSNFWRGRDLFVTKDQRRKLAKFPLQDPEIARLAAAGNMAQPLLFKLLTDHLNKGTRVSRLQLRPVRQNKDAANKVKVKS